MQKKALFSIVLCCFNTLRASDEHAIVIKTQELKEVVAKADLFYNTPRASVILSYQKAKKKLGIATYSYSQHLKELIEQGADPQALQFPGDNCALSTALTFTDISLTEVCLAVGIDPNYQNPSTQNTAFHMLCVIGKHHKNFLQKVALLRFFNARLDIKNCLDETPDDILLRENNKMMHQFYKVIKATDRFKDSTNNVRLPLLKVHLLVPPLAGLVNEYAGIDWDKSWPVIKTCLKKGFSRGYGNKK